MADNIFKELYNKILNLFGQNAEKEESKDIAINRLRVVLMQDRTNLTPDILQRMRKELVELLSKYLEMDKEALELNLEQDGEQMALMLSIPVIRAKDEDEIEAAIKAEEEAKADEESEDESEDGSEEENQNEETEDQSENESDIQSTEDVGSEEEASSDTDDNPQNESEESESHKANEKSKK